MKSTWTKNNPWIKSTKNHKHDKQVSPVNENNISDNFIQDNENDKCISGLSSARATENSTKDQEYNKKISSFDNKKMVTLNGQLDKHDKTIKKSITQFCTACKTIASSAPYRYPNIAPNQKLATTSDKDSANIQNLTIPDSSKQPVKRVSHVNVPIATNNTPISEKKIILKDRLIPIVESMYPEITKNIIELLLQLEDNVLLSMLKDPSSLKLKISEMEITLPMETKEPNVENSSAINPSGENQDVLLTLSQKFKKIPSQQKQIIAARLLQEVNKLCPENVALINRYLMVNEQTDRLLRMLDNDSLLKNNILREVTSIKSGKIVKKIPQSIADTKARIQKNIRVDSAFWNMVPKDEENTIPNLLITQKWSNKKKSLALQLFIKIESIQPQLAGYITCMFLGISNSTMKVLLDNVSILQAHVAKAAAFLMSGSDNNKIDFNLLKLYDPESKEDISFKLQLDIATACVKVLNSKQQNVAKSGSLHISELITGANMQACINILYEICNILYPGFATEITNTLLQLDKPQLLQMFKNESLLLSKIFEIVGNKRSTEDNQNSNNILNMQKAAISDIPASSSNEQNSAECLFVKILVKYPGHASAITTQVLYPETSNTKMDELVELSINAIE